MKQDSAPLLAWHYTLGIHLLRILENGYILPHDQPDTPAVECPLAWFSLNQRYDPSAAKRLEVNGVRQPPTLPVMHQFGNGVYRLGVPPRSLLSRETLRKQARISKGRWQALAQQAQACGSAISEWYGSIDPVPASDCTIEVWQADGTWSRVASPQR
ncbi:MAG: hypothetical protein E6Q31_01500 [Aquabacterium sp.]|nr:MAG: hypothetical protein E6Q31_01500 [Aquabacterium sp.]